MYAYYYKVTLKNKRNGDAMLSRTNSRYSGFTLVFCTLLLCCLFHPLAWGENASAPLLKLGMSLPLTGKNAIHARKWLQGMETAIAEINRKGGLHKKQLKLLALDDAGSPEKCRENLKKLTGEEKIFALIGGFGSHGTRDAILHAENTSTLFFGSSTGLRSSIISAKSHTFSLRPDIFTEVQKLVYKFIDETGKNRVSIFHGTQEYGSEYLSALRGALEKKELHIHSSAAVNAETSPADAAESLLFSRPDMILITADPEETASFIRHIRNTNGEIVLLVLSHTDPISLADILMNRGVGVVLSEAVPFPYYRRIPAVNAYAAAVEAFRSENPAIAIETDFPGFEAYLNVRAFAHILQQAKSLEPEAFVQSAHKQFDVDLGGFRFTFSEDNHTGSDQIYLIQIAPGGFVAPIRSFSEIYAFHP